MEHGWIATKEALPPIGARVLVISKWGHVSDGTFARGTKKKIPMFRPDGLIANVDVKWWMPIPTDGWRALRDERPEEGQTALTMNKYGRIYDGVWKREHADWRPEFSPFVWEVALWREMPPLPDGVKLNH